MTADFKKSIKIKATAEEEKPAVSKKLIGAIADEVTKTLMQRLPTMFSHPKKKAKVKKIKVTESGFFLDTSAIIDGRIFDVISIGLLNGAVVILPCILMELKHLADSQDMVKRERGRKGMLGLEKLRKNKKIKVIVLPDEEEKQFEKVEVDERLIRITKLHKGKLLTCDYNLEKKALIENVTAVNINALANFLKVVAVPGESLHVKISHQGKEVNQGVGYLDDGTMIVVEDAKSAIDKTIDVVISRVIQTATGRILFAKKI